MEEAYNFHGYRITEDSQFVFRLRGIGAELTGELERAAMECQDERNRLILSRLNRLVEEHPEIPMFKNYLSIAYHVRGEHRKAAEINKQLFREHPDYLFARINQANYLIENDETEKVPGVLGETLELKSLYPEREVFHHAELKSFLNVVIRYHAASGDLEPAEEKLDLLKELAPDDYVTEQAETFLFGLRFNNAFLHLQELRKYAIAPEVLKKIPHLENQAPPVFKHDEINNLYQFGIRIPGDKLDEILALPRLSLISDLEAVLQDAVDRYGFFHELDYNEETQSFALHALFLLGELKATESLPRILDFIDADGYFLDFWLDDHKTETLWQVIYLLGLNNISALQQFLVKPGVYTYSKMIVADALSQITLSHPEMRDEMLRVYTAVFETFAEASVEDNLVDTEFMGLAICNVIDCCLIELLPLIETLFERKYVAEGICGDFQDVQQAFDDPNRINVRNILPVKELYQHILSTWSGYTDKVKQYTNDFAEPAQPAVKVKIGRNDPCPCGSGKKYKKCCMK